MAVDVWQHKNMIFSLSEKRLGNGGIGEGCFFQVVFDGLDGTKMVHHIEIHMYLLSLYFTEFKTIRSTKNNKIKNTHRSKMFKCLEKWL